MATDQIQLFERSDQTKTNGAPQLGSKPSATDDYISSVWSFEGSAGERLYRWYGTLPRSLVERLFELYVCEDTRFVDPFMGLGVSLDIAADWGIEGYGMDSNPLACLAASVRLSGPVDQESLTGALEKVSRECRAYRKGETDRVSEWEDVICSERFEYTRKWFREDSLLALTDLHRAIAEIIEEPFLQRYLFVAAAAIVRDVASVDARCTHHLVTKEKPFRDPIPLWTEQARGSLSALRSAPADIDLITLCQASALDLDAYSGSYDLVLAHPPYLGVIHYQLVHRLATDLLDVTREVADPAGLADFTFSHDAIKQADVSTDSGNLYREYVSEYAETMGGVVEDDGRCVVIIGDQRHKGHIRHTFTDFIREFESRGFLLEENFIWVLQNNSGMHVKRRGNFIDHNYILVFHKVE